MISKVEAIQKLKKMGVMVADDHSIVTILIPEGISFETGLKDTVQWYLNNRSWWENIISGDYQNYYENQYGSKLENK